VSLSEHIAGDTLNFTVEVPEYPASDTWVLKYRLTPRFTSPAQVPIDIEATANADGERFDVQVAAATTAAWEPGEYTWSRWVEKAGAQQTLDTDQRLTIRANPTGLAAGYDGRTNARKALDALEAWCAGDRNPGIASHSIASRQIQYMGDEEIAATLSRLRWEVKREENALAAAKGSNIGRPITVRFGSKGS